MTSAVAREVYQQLGKQLLIGRKKENYIETEWSDIWNFNKHFYRPSTSTLSIDKLEKMGDSVVLYEDVLGNRPYIDYKKSNLQKNVFFPHAHAVEQGCRQFGIKPANLKGNVFLSEEEDIEAGKLLNGVRDYIYIEPNCSAFISAPNKDWGFENWQRVVDRLSPRFKFIQTLKSPGDRILKNVTALSTRTVRIASYIVQNAAVFTGTEGGLHHVAAAVDTKSVVVFGGFTSPTTTGYPGHVNLYPDVEGSPCGMLTHCLHCRYCMTLISPEEVAAALERVLKS